MANRTVQFLGYTTDNINIQFTFNGTEVFNGAVTPAGSMGTPAVLFTFDVDQTLAGAIASSMTVTGGDVTTVTLATSHNGTIRETLLGERTVGGVVYPAMTEAELYTASDAANDFQWIHNAENNAKTNIEVDGVANAKPNPTNLVGAWHVTVEDGSTMICDYNMSATPTA